MGTSKQLLKDIAKLKMHKFREVQNKFVVEGDKLVVEAIQSIPQSVLQIFITPETKISSKELEKFNVFEISSADLEKISTQKSPQHSLAIIDSSFQPTETKNDISENVNEILSWLLSNQYDSIDIDKYKELSLIHI